jgi:two-component system sensor histidine kinase RegB
MAVDAGQSSGEGFVEVRALDLLLEAVSSFADRDRIRIEADHERRAPDLLVPRRAVAQALRAVVKNALEASPNGDIVVAAHVKEERCEFLVEDHGQGMNAEVLARAGEPFFTTKEPGSGMGLGLFLSRAVIARLGGELTIDSIPTEHTRVCVSLPRYQRDNLPHSNPIAS